MITHILRSNGERTMCRAGITGPESSAVRQPQLSVDLQTILNMTDICPDCRRFFLDFLHQDESLEMVIHEESYAQILAQRDELKGKLEFTEAFLVKAVLESDGLREVNAELLEALRGIIG